MILLGYNLTACIRLRHFEMSNLRVRQGLWRWWVLLWTVFSWNSLFSPVPSFSSWERLVMQVRFCVAFVFVLAWMLVCSHYRSALAFSISKIAFSHCDSKQLLRFQMHLVLKISIWSAQCWFRACSVWVPGGLWAPCASWKLTKDRQCIDSRFSLTWGERHLH